MPAHLGTPREVQRGRPCPALALSHPGPGLGLGGSAEGWGLPRRWQRGAGAREWAASPRALSVTSALGALAAGHLAKGEMRWEHTDGVDRRRRHTCVWLRAPRFPVGLTALRGSGSG